MANDFANYLLEAAGKDKGELSPDNPYREIGFDGEKKRLGWLKVLPFSAIRISLEKILPAFENKKNFIFVGMGGSINGIKPLLLLFKAKDLYTLYNLDPRALRGIISKIKDLDKILVISISKSGTTQETQLLSLALKELFLNKLGKDKWQEHFLWLSDPQAFANLDSLGWDKVAKVSIQFDEKSDIGGRFSSPHTLIFFLPLFLLFGKDFKKLESTYNLFVSLHDKIRQNACCEAFKYKDKPDAYFSPIIGGNLGKSFSSWIVQLFQESLGSKLKSLPVKTITNFKNSRFFSKVIMDIKVDNPVVSLMAQMYFFQIFIAYYSAFKRLNFVTQDYVEKYKSQMRELENKSGDIIISMPRDIDEIIKEIEQKIKPSHIFIEVVLYFYPDPKVMKRIQDYLGKHFKQKKVIIFIGSDWNHKSYQAAFADKDTFYVLLLASRYDLQLPGISQATFSRNASTLKIIAQATYLTLEEKAVLFSFSP